MGVFWGFINFEKKYMKLLFTILVFVCIAIQTSAQTTLYTQNFETGLTPAGWNLGGTVPSGNEWIINNSYAGSPPFIPNTISQPGTFAGGANSYYLHIHNTSACSGASICNAAFQTSVTPDSVYATTGNIPTSGYYGVALKFYYLSDGAINDSYGKVQYSINGGTNWYNLGLPMWYDVAAWTQITLTDPAIDNQADVRFRFMWKTGAGGQDPAFSIDEMMVEGSSTPVNSITTGTITPTSNCPGETWIIPYTITGTYTSGNVFRAEISDATGSFVSPTTLGVTHASTTSGSWTATLPNPLPPGTAYRIRVISTNPPVTGSDNGSNLTIKALPVVNYPNIDPDTVCHNASAITLSGGNPSGGIYMGSGVSAGVFTPDASLAGVNYINYSYTDATTGCSNTDSSSIFVELCGGISGSGVYSNDIIAYPNPSKGVVFLRQEGSENFNQHLEVLDVAGKLVFVKELTKETEEVTLSPGVYFIRKQGGGDAQKIIVLSEN